EVSEVDDAGVVGGDRERSGQTGRRARTVDAIGDVGSADDGLARDVEALDATDRVRVLIREHHVVALERRESAWPAEPNGADALPVDHAAIAGHADERRRRERLPRLGRAIELVDDRVAAPEVETVVRDDHAPF